MKLDSKEEESCSEMESEDISKSAEDPLNNALNKSLACQFGASKTSSSDEDKPGVFESHKDVQTTEPNTGEDEGDVNKIQPKSIAQEIVASV